MKKSKQIQLVLITAVLASCNRAIIPQRNNGLADSTLIVEPIYGDSINSTAYDPCWYEANQEYWNYPFSLYCYGLMNTSYYYPVNGNVKGKIWRGNRFIVRGGFGKSGVSASS